MEYDFNTYYSQVSLLFMPPRTLSPLVFMSPDNSLCHSPTPPLSLALTFKELQEYPSSVRWCCFYEVHGAMAFLVQMCPGAHVLQFLSFLHRFKNQLLSVNVWMEDWFTSTPWDPPLSESPLTPGRRHWSQVSLKCSSISLSKHTSEIQVYFGHQS